MERIEAIENTEENETLSEKNSKEKTSFQSEKVNRKIEEIRNRERISFNKEELQSIWKLTKDNPTAKTLYETENWEKKDLHIDIRNKAIEIGDMKIKIDLPHGAELKEVDFLNDKVKVAWKLWFFSWSWTASYEKLLPALDNTLRNWYTKIASESGDIKLTRTV